MSSPPPPCPIIDWRSLRPPARATRTSPRDSCPLRASLLSSTGIFLLTNAPGDDDDDDDALLQGCNDLLSHETRQFFALPLEAKLQHVSKDKARRGYAPTMTENFACLIGNQAKNDAVQKFRVGSTAPTQTDDADASSYYSSKEGRVLFYENVRNCSLSEAMVPLHEKLSRLALKLIALIEPALDLEQGWLLAKMHRHTNILTANYYNSSTDDASDNSNDNDVGSADDGEDILISPHTDVSLLTLIICTGPGLQVCVKKTSQLGDHSTREPRDECGWVDVPHLPNAIVVNIGDCLSDCLWARAMGVTSTVHRVVRMRSPRLLPQSPADADAADVDAAGTGADGSSGEAAAGPRQSLALFVSPNHDARLGWDEAGSITYAQWRRNKIKKSMQALK